MKNYKLKKRIKNYFIGNGELGKYWVFLMENDDADTIVEAVKESMVEDIEKIIDKTI